MDKKWKIQNRKDYLKTHVAVVDIKTEESLALEEVTDEKVHDGKVLKKLVNHVLNGFTFTFTFTFTSMTSTTSTTTTTTRGPSKMVIKIKATLGDWAYDSNANFRYLREKGSTPSIKIRKNSVVSP
jgi:hypothetical protein